MNEHSAPDDDDEEDHEAGGAADDSTELLVVDHLYLGWVNRSLDLVAPLQNDYYYLLFLFFLYCYLFHILIIAVHSFYH